MRWIQREHLRILLALSVMIPAGGGVGVADVIWTAYNDCLKEAGDSTAANVTEWTIHQGDLTHGTGRLRDFETGSRAMHTASQRSHEMQVTAFRFTRVGDIQENRPRNAP